MDGIYLDREIIHKSRCLQSAAIIYHPVITHHSVYSLSCYSYCYYWYCCCCSLIPSLSDARYDDASANGGELMVADKCGSCLREITMW